MGEMGEMGEMGGRAAPDARCDVISLTRHARCRGARRNVAPDAVEYVVAHGRMVRRTGVMFFFLGRRDIPTRDRCASWATRLEGTIVVVAADGSVITVYRNRHGLHPIARKMKYRLFEHRPGFSDPDSAHGAEGRGTQPLMVERATA